MYHSYFFFRKLVESLELQLPGYKVGECFSQNKDELIIGLYEKDLDWYFKCALAPDIGIISFPKDFKRARKNSVDLFPSIMDNEVVEVKQVPFDRSFYLQFKDGKQLLFKMHGRRSNILLLSEGKVIDIFRKNLTPDKNISISVLQKSIDIQEPSEEDFRQLRKLLGRTISGDSNDAEVRSLSQKLLNSSEYFLYNESDGRPEMALLEPEKPLYKSHSPIEVSNELAKYFTQEYQLQNEKGRIIRMLEKKIRASESYVRKSFQELEALENRRSYEEIANIIMANLHQIPKGELVIHLEDFYRNETIEIKLKNGLSPQKHAETLYKKAKNEKIQVQKIEENIANKEKLITELKSIQEQLKTISSHKELRSFIKEKDLLRSTNETEIHLPYHEYSYADYSIWVGKNAQANDKLTLKFSHKNDLWLHARDVPGSHVLIKNQNGQKVPAPVVEWAAGIAAFYSKRKKDSLCPVIVTPKKYVRKRKGAPAGQVVVDREEVVMVKPHKPEG